MIQNVVPQKVAPMFKEMKGIYLKDKTGELVEGSEQSQQYLTYLLEQGVKINNLHLAQFRIKNGLPYIGLMATDTINPGEPLVIVPKHLMLTTKIAYFSELQEIFDAHPQVFSAYHSGNWQDRVILVYVLRQYQLQHKSQWYHLVNNLPRDIDYLIFWDEQELKWLNDKQMIINAKKERKEFELMYQTLKIVLDKYPQYFDKDTYSYDNIKWIHIHLVSRCFGSSIAQVSFVPFCELFNHENTDVRYTGLYNDGNPHKEQAKQLEEINSSDESDGESDDHQDSDDEYPEHILDQVHVIRQRVPQYKLIEQELEAYKLKVNYKDPQSVQQLKDYEIRQYCRTELCILALKTKRWLQENINLVDNISILFVETIMASLKQTCLDYDNSIVSYDEAQLTLNVMHTNCNTYLTQVQAYSKRAQKVVDYSLKQFDFKDKTEEPQTPEEIFKTPIVTGVELFDKPENWNEDLFDQFVIKCSLKDKYEKGAQAFFCYGNESNRLLLMRYGFALEYNKFEHIFIRINYLDEVPHAIDIAEYFKLPKYCRFKIQYTKICEDLLMYFKLKHWKYSDGIDAIFNDDTNLIQPIDDAIKLLSDYQTTNIGKETLTQLETQLSDTNIGYHQYFALVFRIEQLRIIQSQIEAYQLLKAQILHEDQPNSQFPWSKRLVYKFMNRK